VTIASRQVSIGSADRALWGVFDRPAGDLPRTAILILPGSGPVDRDGNLPGARNDSLKQLADGLVQAGFACLRIDKRGIDASRAAALDEAALRLDTYVEDAINWLAFLRDQERVSTVALIGHSEGALIATLAAQRFPLAALILLAGAGRPAGDLLRQQLATAALPDDLRQQALSILRRLLTEEGVIDTPPSLAALFRPCVQPYLRSWLARDPARELANVSAPTLIVQGGRDLQVSEEDATILSAAQPKAHLAVIKDMNHILKSVPDDRAANLASYDNPDLPIVAGLLPVLTGFLRSVITAL
jgi:hypothetical protein